MELHNKDLLYILTFIIVHGVRRDVLNIFHAHCRVLRGYRHMCINDFDDSN